MDPKRQLLGKGVAVVAEDKLAFIYEVKNISEGPKNATFWRLEKTIEERVKEENHWIEAVEPI